MKMRRKMTAILLTAIMLISMLPAAAAAATDVTISTSKSEVNAGESFTVTLTVPAVSKLVATAQFKVLFDNSKFEITAFAPPSLTGASKTNSDPASANGNGFFNSSYDSVSYDNSIDLTTGLVIEAAARAKEGASGIGSFEIAIADAGWLNEETWEDENQLTMPENNKVTVTVLSTVSSVAAAITAPAKGATPQAAIADTDTYTGGSITWTPSAAAFGADTAYKATATLTAKDGYKFASNAAVTVAGASSVSIVSNTGDSLTFTATFPSTASADALTDEIVPVIDLDYTFDGSTHTPTFGGALVRDAGEDVGDYRITLGTLDAGGNFTIALSDTPVTMSITAKDVTENRAAVDASVVVGIGAFTEPSFGEAIGTLVYDYDGATTYDAVVAKLAALPAGSSGSIGYAYTANGNYTGTISGTINFTVVDKADAGASVSGDRTATYGDAAFTVSGSVTDAGEGTGAWAWSVTSGTSATVDAATGKVTIQGAGVTVIQGHYESETTVGEDTLTVTVNKKPVTISGVTAADKVYDGTAAATANGTPAIAKVGNDDVSVTAGTAAFADKNVGKNKTVIFSDYALSGADKDKYELTAQPSATATITAAELAPVVTAVDRDYNETNTVELAAGAQNVFGGDDVSLNMTKASGTMADADVGEGKAVTVTGVALTGADAGNYRLASQPTGVTVTIRKAAAKQLAVNATQRLESEQFRYDISADVPETAGAVSAYAANGAPVNTDDTSMTEFAVSGAGVVTAKVTASKEGDVVALPLRVTAKNYDCEITLNVKIVPNTHTVEFNANGGKGTMLPQTVEDGVATKLNDNAFIRSGYRFTGWNTQADGRGTAYANRANVTLADDLTLYARWSKVNNGDIATTNAVDTADAVGSGRRSGGSSSIGSRAATTATTAPIGAWNACGRGGDCLLCRYADVSPAEWYHDGVHYCLEKNLMVGTGADTFAPDAAVSRAQLVTILWRMEGSPASGSGSFADVTAGSWYAQAVGWAAANNIVGGYGDDKFGPDDSITREQFAAILYRYAGYKGYNVNASADLGGYADSGKVSGWASAAMGWANAAGLITGMTGATLDPTGSATRAQAAAIIQRFCVNVAGK